MLSGVPTEPWSAAASWRGEGLRREVFFFRSRGVELYGSLYAASDISRPFGVLACNSWGLEADRFDPLQRTLALQMARLGGAGMVFHYPGYGDSYGDLRDVGLDDLADAAVDALAEAERRCPGLTWVHAGVVLGASVAVLAQRRSAPSPLLFVQPALRPGVYFRRLAARRRPLAPGSGRPKQMLEAGEDPHMAYGYPLPQRIVERGAEADEAVAVALRTIAPDGVAIAQGDPGETGKAVRGLEQVPVAGVWRYGSLNNQGLTDAAVDWLSRRTATGLRPRHSDRDELEGVLRRFIVDELLEERFDGRDPLAAGVVDSLAIEQLVDFIEEELGVAFRDEELIAENFQSIPHLAALAMAKAAGERDDR